jgi:phage portal protein BeeE
MQLTGEETDAIENHPFELLLRRPNPLYSRTEFLEATYSYRALTGTAYWWLNKANETAAPDEMWVLPTEKITPVPDGHMFIRGYLFDPGGTEQPILLEAHEVVQFRKWHPRNPFVGLSPVEALATIAAGDMKMQEWNTNLFAKDNAKMPNALA